MEILSLKPTVKDTIWGGRKLIENFGFTTTEANIAEAWLLSCHKDGPAYVAGGEYDGKTLAEVIETEGREVLGTDNANIPDFPVLIKIIDACDKLSIQVHPGDEYARRVENENGKTEAWYILEAEPDAQLVYGVSKEMSREEFAEMVKAGRTEDVLNFVNVKAGDVVFIPSGMLHAIGKGILLAEVQQSSNTTYRVYDYNRPGKDGKPRELHIQKAIDVVELTHPEGGFAPAGEPVEYEGGVKTYLTGCEYFSMTALNVDGDFTDAAVEKSFVSLLVLEGEGMITGKTVSYELKKGSSVFIPAAYGEYKLSGSMKILETRT